MKRRTLAFDVTGVAKPDVRPRIANGGVKLDRATEHWKSMVRDEALEAIERAAWPKRCRLPIVVRLEFVQVVRASRARGPAGPHVIRPDIDNLSKPVLDAMKNAGVFGDDCVVVELSARKRWQAGGERFAGVKVMVVAESMTVRGASEEE